MARLNSMYGSIGSMANKVLRGGVSASAIRAARGSMPTGMRGSIADTVHGINVKTGRKVAGGAAAMGMMGMANRKGPVGGYNPRRPVMPVPQNGRPM